MLVRVVVVARAVVNLAAWMAAFNLDRRMADGELPAKPALEVSDDVLSVSEQTITNHHMAAQCHFVR